MNVMITYKVIPSFWFYYRAEFISLQEAAAILQRELNYPADRALHYAQSFDRNKDGRLSRSEFQAFKAKIEET